MGKNERLHFGVILSMLDNTCQYDIWTGILKFATENNISISVFFGAYQASDDDFASHFDTIFATINENKSLDGVIIFSGFIAQLIGKKEFEKYLARIPENFPLVSISYVIPGIPSVIVDNIMGIYVAVEHLIKVHGKSNIAFIKGPDGHPEAEERLAGYKKALRDNNIIYNESYVFPGNFSQLGGVNAIRKIKDMPYVTPDAIVACDDETAIGVLHELKKQGTLVPADIAVIGFDDDRYSATYIPSLSTARQDFIKIGMVSTETLLKIVNGEPVLDITYISPVFVARQSCGCSSKEFANAEVYDEAEVRAESLTTFASEKLVAIFPNNIPEIIISEWIKSLVAGVKKQPFSQEDFLAMVSGMLVNYHHYSKDFLIWNKVLNILTIGVELHHDEVDNSHTILSTLIMATTLIHDIRYKEGKVREFILDDDRITLRRTAGNLVLNFDLDSLAKELYKSLPEISINTAFLGIYQKPIRSDNPDADRTIDTLIGFDGDRKFNVKHNTKNPIYFSNYNTIEGFDFASERRDLFFIPLFFKDVELGVMLIPYYPDISVGVYETLRVNISTAIKGAELISQIQTISITDELTGLLNRRGFFQYVYSRLSYLRRDVEMIHVVMFMDMDGLKTINDTYGHKEGDVAISIFADALKQVLRKEDVVGRIGGDEFIVFSTVKSKSNAENVEARIRAKLEEYNALKLHPYKVMASIGSVILDSPTINCFEAAMLSADSVLYEEKMAKKKKGLSRI